MHRYTGTPIAPQDGPTTPDPSSDAPVDFVVLGAMKCGTTSLHHYLSEHPNVLLAPEKEMNFFFGSIPGEPGNLWRGMAWYRDRLPADGRLRGDVSPGYTSPDHPDVAARIAAAAPDVKLLYLVRDPLARAVSQYRHHRRDGTEPRSLADALLDPAGHYLLRSRYADRLRPFLEHFSASQVGVVEHEDLLHRTRDTVGSICRFLGIAPLDRPGLFDRRLNGAGSPPPPVPDHVAAAFAGLVADDGAEFAQLRQSLCACTPDGGILEPGTGL
jgi:hypothetical protein